MHGCSSFAKTSTISLLWSRHSVMMRFLVPESVTKSSFSQASILSSEATTWFILSFSLCLWRQILEPGFRREYSRLFSSPMKPATHLTMLTMAPVSHQTSALQLEDLPRELVLKVNIKNWELLVFITVHKIHFNNCHGTPFPKQFLQSKELRRRIVNEIK